MATQTFTDQTGFSFQLEQTPKRIISLVPSQTELLYYLGLDKNIVGVTKFCVHPNHLVRKTSKIGGTKKFDFEKIEKLEPDLILANKEENYKEGIEILRENYPVWTSDIFNITDALEMISQVGKLTYTEQKAEKLVDNIKGKFSKIANLHSRTVLYFIWQKPHMVAGNNTFINVILQHLGFNNLGSEKERYPEITPLELEKINPDYVFLSTEPFPFKEKHKAEYQKLFPNAKIILVDGEMFSWYGNRLLLAADYFKMFLNS